MLDPQAAVYLEQLRALAAPSYWEIGHVEARRLVDEAAPALFGESDPVASVDETDADGVRVRVYHPSAAELPALVWFHGGGWVLAASRRTTVSAARSPPARVAWSWQWTVGSPRRSRTPPL